MKYTKSGKGIATIVAGILIAATISTTSCNSKGSEDPLKVNLTDIPLDKGDGEKDGSSTAAKTKASVGIDAKALFENQDAFKEAFNNSCKEQESELRVTEIKNGEEQMGNTFQASLTANIGIVGTLNEVGGFVKEITMIGNGDGSAQSGVDLYNTMAGLIGSVDPSLDAAERSDILKKFKFVDNNGFRDLKSSTDLNGIHYFISCSSSERGIVFGAARQIRPDFEMK